MRHAITGKICYDFRQRQKCLLPAMTKICYNSAMPRKQRKVLIALKMSGIAGQSKLAGVFRYLNERYGDRPPWNVRLIRTRDELTAETVRQAIAERTDGFIVSNPDAIDSVSPLAKASTPTVVMDMHVLPLERRREKIAFIRNSGDEIGNAAADYLMGQGTARTYAFLHADPVTDWSRARFDAFRRRLNGCGLWCEELHSPEQALKLKRPAAIFAANDDRAFELLKTLAARRLKVPQNVAVLGVDNDTLICEHAQPSLSSVQPDFEEEGHLAAKTLDAMMDGERLPERTLFVGVKEIVRRDSTSEMSHAGRLVQRALAYIERHALDGIDVGNVVAHMKCSRRLADLRFRELQGRSIRQAIEGRRMDEVRRLLAETRDSIETVAEACGYSRPNHLRNLFKKRFAMTMSEFRRSATTHRRV